MTVNEYLKKEQYHFVTIVYKNFTLALRQPKNKILEIPECCEGIGKMPVKAAEIKKEKELILYV